MNDKNMAVLVDIIGAVEAGGQVYGKRNYAGYAAPYANSPTEHTVTLGWAQNYGGEAKKLIQMIHDADTAAFGKLDSSGSIAAMLKKDWVALCWKPSAAQKKVLIALIDSPAGHECQDKLFAQLAQTYINECEKQFTKDVPAVMMYCEIRHLGGAGPAARIFSRLDGDYSLAAIMESLKKDQEDKGNDNQVGDKKYWSRHEKCREFIEKYAVLEKKEENKVKYSRQKVVDLMKSWIGKKESDGSYKSIIDIYNTLEAGKLPRGTKMDYSWPWCACTWSALAVKLGYTKIMPVEISCYYLIEEAKKLGIWQESDKYVPIPGDAVLYDWEDGANYAATDNMGTPDHVGTVISVDKAAGTFIVGEGNKDNAVGTRTLKVNGRYIRGFITPKYTDNDVQDAGTADIPQETGTGKYLPGKTTVQLEMFLVGAQHPQVKAIQRILKALGYKGKDGKKLTVDGSLGENTAYAVECFQRDKGMKDINFGTVAATTWTYLLNS